HAFEPNPMLWPQFERNVSLNGLRNVTLHKIGLADRDEEMTLHLIDKPNFGLGTFSMIEQYDRPIRPSARCTVRRGDDYLSAVGVGEVDAVKIDVQGFEPEVLQGLTCTLTQNRPVVWCEVGPGTAVRIATYDDLRELVPFEFQCFQMCVRSRW